MEEFEVEGESVIGLSAGLEQAPRIAARDIPRYFRIFFIRLVSLKQNYCSTQEQGQSSDYSAFYPRIY